VYFRLLNVSKTMRKWPYEMMNYRNDGHEIQTTQFYPHNQDFYITVSIFYKRYVQILLCSFYLYRDLLLVLDAAQQERKILLVTAHKDYLEKYSHSEYLLSFH